MIKWSILFLFFCCELYAGTLEIMSYNVENLFDAKHDITNGKDNEDWAFLPRNAKGKKEACLKESSKKRRRECLRSDWTEKKVDLKLNQISEVVKSKYKNLPDFLGLVEVENKSIVSRLAHKLGYTEFEITNGPDLRGMNVALLFKKNKFVKKVSRNELVVNSEYPTRNILEVEFLIDEKYPLVVFVNHWPSQHNPDSMRLLAAVVLKNRILEIQKKNPSVYILAMGDFNTIDTNNPHPFKTVLLQNNILSDVNSLFQTDNKISDIAKKNMPSGTYFFTPEKTWSMLDHFFINQNLINNKEMKVNLASFEIYSKPFMLKELRLKRSKNRKKGTEDLGLEIHFIPLSFNSDSKKINKLGYSDHLPICLKVDYADNNKIHKVLKPSHK